MRTHFTFFMVAQTMFAFGQDWALINPAYRYNYSDDGTDTISNQIRVMEVDTLGPDSIRYELNRIAVVCDTCPASLGGPCDGCYVRVNQPQFLGFDCIRSANDWHFLGPDTFLVRSDASVGASWVFDASTGVTATVVAEWPASVFTTPDTLRRILLSSGDTLILSRSFGITHFANFGERHELIGVEGAGVGRSFPNPMAYFDFQPGDHLIYKVNSIWWASPPGGPSFHAPTYYFYEVVITGRTDRPDSVEYVTSVARSSIFIPYPGSVLDEPNWTPPLNQWSFHLNSLLASHPILTAYPGQVLDTAICWSSYYNTGYLVQHGITVDGRSTIGSRTIGQAWGGPTGGLDFSQSILPELFPSIFEAMVNVQYEEGLGLRKVEFKGEWLGASLSVELVGAIIGGDTIIPPPVINWQVGLNEKQLSGIAIFPNPADDVVTVRGAIGVSTIAIHDLEGRLIRTARINSENEAISVQDIKDGIYLLSSEGHLPQRLVIVR